MTYLYHPTPRLIARNPGLFPLVFPSGTDVGDVALPLCCLATGWVVIALVSTQVLGCLRKRFWSLHHYYFPSIGQQLHVMAVGPSNYHGQRDALTFGQQAPLSALLATVRGIGPSLLPPKGALVIAPSMLCQVHSKPTRSS
jgi:hypothetical protein